MCPSALRYADLADRLRQLGHQVNDMGNVDIPVRETLIETGQENVMPVMIGIRELDLKEREMLKQSNIKVYTMRDIDEQGMSTIIKKTMDRFAHVDNIHVSLDVDSLDPQIAPGVGTPVPGGLTYREAHLLMETIADSKKLSSMDIVEINPMLDRHNETAQMAIELTASLLGKCIF